MPKSKKTTNNAKRGSYVSLDAYMRKYDKRKSAPAKYAKQMMPAFK